MIQDVVFPVDRSGNMPKGRIRVETTLEGGTKAVGTIPQFDTLFYVRVMRDADEADLGGLKAKLNWKGGYGQVVSILVDERDAKN